MKAQITINEPVKEKDYFPCLFTNESKKVIILADGRTSERTFSGMVIYTEDGAKNAIGTYSSNWSYNAYKRLPKGTNVVIGITQEE